MAPESQYPHENLHTNTKNTKYKKNSLAYLHVQKCLQAAFNNEIEGIMKFHEGPLTAL